MMNLRETWLQLSSKYSKNLSLQQELLTEIVTAYQESKRFYHNLDHLVYLVDLANQYQTQIEDFDTLLFSIFYHDIIYQVRQKNNEIESAELAAKRLSSLNYPSSKIQKCSRQIRATIDHQFNQESDTNWLLDFDLAILGEARSKYVEYTKNIRKEYAIYSDEIYCQGRSQVLNRLLETKPLYKTKLLQDKFEQAARENLNWELKELKTDD